MPPLVPILKYTCSFCYAGDEKSNYHYVIPLDALEHGASEGCVRCAIWRAGVNTLVPAEQQSSADRLSVLEKTLPEIIYQPPRGDPVIHDHLPGKPTSYRENRIFLEIFTTSGMFFVFFLCIYQLKKT
jgi:hypothetical protein